MKIREDRGNLTRGWKYHRRRSAVVPVSVFVLAQRGLEGEAAEEWKVLGSNQNSAQPVRGCRVSAGATACWSEGSVRQPSSF